MEYDLIKDMFLEYLKEEAIVRDKDKITIYFISKRKSCKCPSCNTTSNTVSTYFIRKIQDLNIIEKPLFLIIKLGTYRCENLDCDTKIFSEKIEELAGIKSRRTTRLNDMLTKFALTQSAESAARRCSEINIKVSGDTLLRLSKKWESLIDKEKVYSIGIADFALKKHYYGTVIIDLDTRKVIEILNTRDPEEIQETLNKYPNLNTVSRDRGYSYKSVSKEYTHIADRFHLIMSFSDSFIRKIKNKIPKHIYFDNKNIDIIKHENKRNEIEYTEKQKQKQKLILDIKEEYTRGKSARSIANEYNIDRRTVSKYIKTEDVEQESVYDSINRNCSYLSLLCNSF